MSILKVPASPSPARFLNLSFVAGALRSERVTRRWRGPDAIDATRRDGVEGTGHRGRTGPRPAPGGRAPTPRRAPACCPSDRTPRSGPRQMRARARAEAPAPPPRSSRGRRPRPRTRWKAPAPVPALLQRARPACGVQAAALVAWGPGRPALRRRPSNWALRRLLSTRQRRPRNRRGVQNSSHLQSGPACTPATSRAPAARRRCAASRTRPRAPLAAP